ncbi:hypothetical protein GCM10027569_87240 [Flindersiella endophytica]
MEFTTPQNSAGSEFTSCGPGLTPWMSSAPKITAIVAFAGMPNVSRGIKERNRTCTRRAPHLVTDTRRPGQDLVITRN